VSDLTPREAELLALLKECLPLVEGARQALAWGYMLNGTEEELSGFARKGEEVERLIERIRVHVPAEVEDGAP
jgi:hypothetical protein